MRNEAAQIPADDRLARMLAFWADGAGKPTVLFLDEVDALVGDTLISLLRQIRAGYAQRPQSFPQSVILCGVRDYRIHTSHNEVITGGSAFNIKAKSLRLGSFIRTEVVDLFTQHTTETGQAFAPEIFDELRQDAYTGHTIQVWGHETGFSKMRLRSPAAKPIRCPVTRTCVKVKTYSEIIPSALIIVR